MKEEIAVFKSRAEIEVISDAYISGRYLPRRYTREEVEGKLDLYRELLEIVES